MLFKSGYLALIGKDQLARVTQPSQVRVMNLSARDYVVHGVI